MQFLMGLNESYAPNRAQILMMDPLLVISKIFVLVMQEKRQWSIHNDASVPSMDRSFLPYQSSLVATVKGHFTGDRCAKHDNRPVVLIVMSNDIMWINAIKYTVIRMGIQSSSTNNMIIRLMLIKFELQPLLLVILLKRLLLALEMC